MTLPPRPAVHHFSRTRPIIQPNGLQRDTVTIMIQPNGLQRDTVTIIIQPNGLQRDTVTKIMQPNGLQRDTVTIIMQPNGLQWDTITIIIQGPTVGHNNHNNTAQRPTTAIIIQTKITIKAKQEGTRSQTPGMIRNYIHRS